MEGDSVQNEFQFKSNHVLMSSECFAWVIFICYVLIENCREKSIVYIVGRNIEIVQSPPSPFPLSTRENIVILKTQELIRI